VVATADSSGGYSLIDNDVLSIARRLKEEVNENLQLAFNHKLDLYQILFNNQYGQLAVVYTFPPGEKPTLEIIQKLQMADASRGHSSYDNILAIDKKRKEINRKHNKALMEEADDLLQKRLQDEGLVT